MSSIYVIIINVTKCEKVITRYSSAINIYIFKYCYAVLWPNEETLLSIDVCKFVDKNLIS